MCGDMNIKLNARDTSTTFRLTRACNRLRMLMLEFDLIDVWRKRFPQTRKYTWRKISPLQQSRLDNIFISKNMYRGKQTKTRIDPGIFSDHNFVFAELDARKTVKGPGIWRFDNFLLENDEFKGEIRDEIGKCIQRDTPYDGDISMGLRIEMLLSNCRSIAMRKRKEIKRQQRKDEDELTEKLRNLELNLNVNDTATIQAYESVKYQLEQIKQRKGELAILASGARWIEQGEKPSSYFLNLCKKRSKQKSILALKVNEGELLTRREDILTHCG